MQQITNAQIISELRNRRVVGLGIATIALLGIVLFVSRAIFFPTDNGPVEKTRVRLRTLATLLVTYKKKTGQFPTVAQGLGAAVDSANIAAIARPSLVCDGWGAPFVYKPGTPPILYSIGENGLDNLGDGDDIALSIQSD